MNQARRKRTMASDLPALQTLVDREEDDDQRLGESHKYSSRYDIRDELVQHVVRPVRTLHEEQSVLAGSAHVPSDPSLRLSQPERQRKGNDNVRNRRCCGE